MGDRGTCVLLGPQPLHKRHSTAPVPIFVFTYFQGPQLPQKVAAGLHRSRSRWGQPSYVTRHVIAAITADVDVEPDSYGVGLTLWDRPTETGRPFLVVDTRLRAVAYVDWCGDPARQQWTAPTWWPFDYWIGQAQWPQNMGSASDSFS